MKKNIYGIVAFVMAAFMVGCTALAKQPMVQGNKDAQKEIDLKGYFGNVEGCAVFYSNNEDMYYVYNPDLLNVREVPCSTFKVVAALAGLENNVIQDEHTVLRWDGVKRDFPGWNQDLSMASAIQLSATWYFDEITKQVGMDKVAAIVKEISYGNMDASGGIQLWSNSLKISPFEQIDFVKKMFRNELPFEQKNVDMVKKAMYIPTENGKLHGKTGTSGSNLENDGQTAWFVGDYKTEQDEYYFAVRIFGDHDRKDITGGNAQSITQKILNKEFTK